jgi:hypothetical protein
LVSASDWGSEGRRFESGRPDETTRLDLEPQGHPDRSARLRITRTSNVIRRDVGMKVARGEDPGHLGPDPEVLVLMEAPAGQAIV